MSETGPPSPGCRAALKLGTRVHKRNLFVSFAESDGGHSYLATRAMLNASSIGHLIFRTTVSDALDAVTAGQANYAVVPLFNSITQWEGTTLKALASGQLEIFAQACMPTSYVLAAHKEYMAEIVERYQALSDREEKLCPERAKKIYTRFLTRIFVGSQAEEQYKGRLQRPDMSQATIEHSRNPLRVLEEITRTELMNELKTGTRRGSRPQNESIGGSKIWVDLQQKPATISELNVPAAMIAAGLLDKPQDNDGWDRHGSVGEILSLLKNLLGLLDVYSFGAPDLPENKTQYVLVGRRLAGAPAAEALRTPENASPARIMTMIRSTYKKSSTDQWLKPREGMEKILKDYGYVLDRSPIMIATGTTRSFLMEGGKLKGHASSSGTSAGGIWGGAKKTLREKIEYRPDPKPKAGTPEDVYRFYLGEYRTWCPEGSGESCWCCEEAVETKANESLLKPLFAWLAKNAGPILGAALIAGTLAAFAYILFSTMTGSGPLKIPPTGPTPDPSSTSSTPTTQPPVQSPEPPMQTGPSTPPTSSPVSQQPPHSPYPALQGDDDQGEVPSEREMQRNPAYPGYYPKNEAPAGSSDKKPTTSQPVPFKHVEAKPAPQNAPAKTAAVTKPTMLHIAFYEAKSNLTPRAQSTLAEAATQSLQRRKPIRLRVFAIVSAAETDPNLWRRRLYAVKDELVRLGVPVSYISTEGSGPFIINIKIAEPPKPSSAKQRMSFDLDSIDDPFANN